MELNRKNLQKILLVALIVVFFYWLLHNVSVATHICNTVVDLLTPFIVGLFIAFILNVPMRGIEEFLAKLDTNGKIKKFYRPIGLLLSFCFVAAIVIAVMFIVVPELIRTIRTISVSVVNFLPQLEVWFNHLMDRWPEVSSWIQMLDIDWSSISQKLIAFLQDGATSIVGSTVSLATSVFSLLFNFILGLIFAIYILLQKEKLSRQGKMLLYAYLPEHRADQVIYVLKLSNKNFTNFLTGQCLEAVILGFMFFLAMSILRMPYAMMISVLIAFTALIPIFGAFIGCALGAFFIVVNNPLQALWFIILFLVLQQVEGNLIYPRVVGSSVGLPAIWVLVAVTVGGSTLGVVGMLIFVPIFSVLYTLLKECTKKRIRVRKITEEKITAHPQPESQETTSKKL